MQSFFNSKFGRSCIALVVGGLAGAGPAMVMGDIHAGRVALSTTVGALMTLIALHFKSEGDAS